MHEFLTESLWVPSFVGAFIGMLGKGKTTGTRMAAFFSGVMLAIYIAPGVGDHYEVSIKGQQALAIVVALIGKTGIESIIDKMVVTTSKLF